MCVGVSEQCVNLFFQNPLDCDHISLLCFKDGQTGLEKKGVRHLGPAVKTKKSYVQCKSRDDYCKLLNMGSEQA